MPAQINGTDHLAQIVKKKITPLHLTSLWEEGDYHFETITPGLLLEFRVQYGEEANSIGIRELCFVVSYFEKSSGDKITVTAIEHFRTYTHKQLVREIHRALAKEMFNRLGQNKEMVFDGIDHYKEFKTNPRSELAKLVSKAQKDFYRGYQYVRNPFKTLTQQTVQF